LTDHSYIRIKTTKNSADLTKNLLLRRALILTFSLWWMLWSRSCENWVFCIWRRVAQKTRRINVRAW